MTSFGGTLTYKPTSPEPAPATLLGPNSRILSRCSRCLHQPGPGKTTGHHAYGPEPPETMQALQSSAYSVYSSALPTPSHKISNKGWGPTLSPLTPLPPAQSWCCHVARWGTCFWRLSEDKLLPSRHSCVFMSYLSKTNLQYILI